MEHKYKSRVINGFVVNLKSTIFDVMTSMRRNMDIIEAQIGSVQDEQKGMELQQLWAEYHEADKQCLIAAKRMETAMEKLDSCFQAYYTSLYQPTKPSSTPNEEENAPSVDETPKEEAENNTSEQSNESEATTTVTENNTDVIPTEAAEENPTTEETKEDSGIIPTEVVSDATVTPVEAKETITEAPIEKDSEKEEPVSENGIIPLETDATPSTPTEEEKEKTTTPEVTESKELIPLPKEETTEANEKIEASETTEKNEATEDSKETKQIFIKLDNSEPRAIIVSSKQKQKLLDSQSSQKALLEDNTVIGDNVSQEQIEQLMNQLPELYAKGEVAKAEEISEQIRALSEKMKSTNK